MRAALYLRSSKDRHDVSLDAQRDELTKLAETRGLTIAAEFSDAVESGSSENRPGFISLLEAIRNPKRGWEVLLVFDTSRIARRRYIAQALKHEATKRRIQIIYAKLPVDLDPVSEVVLESVFQAMDEVHSLLSAEKGRMGMRQNVKRGFRAGGRAPIGYQLERIPTGTIRDGQPVTKSKLIPSPDAPVVTRYLKARASGLPRSRLIRDLGMKWSPSTLIHVEWNALVYAGHTCWNQRVAGKKVSRDEWEITRNTHEPLITDAEAETLIRQLETSDIGRAVSAGKAAVTPHLLTGILMTSDGEKWTVAKGGKVYRIAGKFVQADLVNQAVLDTIRRDLSNLGFWKTLLDAVQKNDPTAGIDKEIKRLERERERAARKAVETDDGGIFVGVVEERTRQINALRRERELASREGGLFELVSRTTPADLAQMALENPSAAVSALVEEVTLNRDLTCQIRYRCASMASPRGANRYAPVSPVYLK